MPTLQNPLPGGWKSDPSIVRVGKDYYLATSTFEWMPGVNLFHSTDLIHWEQLPSVLDDGFIDLEGIQTACGIWAPNLTWRDGVFYLAYTIVQTARYRFKDTHNYLVTATDIRGPWSKPVYLHSIGFDPSVFHDDDGQMYIVSQTMEHRTDRSRFQGVTLQPFDLQRMAMTGKPRIVFSGTERGTTEGPNIIKKDGWYYITAAEGGTEFGHCVTMARSLSLYGPYEVDPDNPMMSSTGTDCLLQRAGHGQYFTDVDGNWYMAHLCARPLEGRWSITGRECAIQNIHWPTGGWPRLAGKATASQPATVYTVPDAPSPTLATLPDTVWFDRGLPVDWMTLRRCAGRCGISHHPGGMRITGGNSLCSDFNQHLTARRIDSLCFVAWATMTFAPRCPNHLAGLVCLYNGDNWHYLSMSTDDDAQPILTVTTCDNGEVTDRCTLPLPGACQGLRLGVSGHDGTLQFSFDPGSGSQPIGPELDMRILSDEHVAGNGFTSAMIGLCCQDLQGDGVYADFASFAYRRL